MALPTETYTRMIDMLRARDEAAAKLRQPDGGGGGGGEGQPILPSLADTLALVNQVGSTQDALAAQQLQAAKLANAKTAADLGDAPTQRRLAMLKSIAETAAATGQDPTQLARMAGLPFDFSSGGGGPNPAAMGAALGLPPPPPAVSPAGMSQKSREAFRLARAKATDQRLSAIDEANKSADIEYPVQRFLELNQQNPTGGWRSLPGIQDLLTKFSAPRQEMESITSRLVPQLGRQGLPGSASNLDVQMFRSAVVSPDKSVQANMSIGNGLIAQQQRNKQHAEFLHAYADAYGNDLRGADQAWQQYVDANPIFDPEAAAKGEPSLNQNRMTWQQFFSSRGQPAAAAPAAGGERPPLSAFMRYESDHRI